MHLLTLICGIVLLEKAYTLKCYECVPGSAGDCTDKETQCPRGQRCGALRILTYAGDIKAADVNMKSCLLANQCIEGSINFGLSKTVITSRCCNSELCNSQPAPAGPSKSSPNGKKCYSCNGQKCTTILNCEGNEDHCISSKVTIGRETVTVKGCASKLICSNEAQIPGSVGAEISCCQGDLCNSASSTGAGFLLLVAPLLASVVFS
uniref:urokinase plasminogen activator surface receptor-like n=1 Tax=Semicossyphus pulcher TaxID=241346 RepID=UPI0037E7E1BC